MATDLQHSTTRSLSRTRCSKAEDDVEGIVDTLLIVSTKSTCVTLYQPDAMKCQVCTALATSCLGRKRKSNRFCEMPWNEQYKDYRYTFKHDMYLMTCQYLESINAKFEKMIH